MPHPDVVSIATWNVNSVRSRLQHLLEWLKESRTDIVLLQELKTTEDNFPRMEIEELGYNLAIHGEKSYNGVAILSRYPLSDISKTLPGDPSDIQSRYIEAVASLPGKAIRVASVYVPNGQSPDSDKFVYKLAFLERLAAHLQDLRRFEEVFVCGGDYNVAPYPCDIYDPKRLDGTTCYHPAERTRLRAILHSGYYDAFRLKHPDDHSYSWWDYRGSSWAANLGYRIDHLLLSPQAADCLQDCVIEKELRAKDKASDHAPVVGILKL